MNAPESLLEWYREHRRDLPWRRTAEPWPIWVSEVMLQQTRVDSAAPYFERFVERFPTPAALAAVTVDEALASWSGLGYYRRLRLLHRAARLVAAAGGEVPRDPVALRRLPGVGDYTAAAIASIAFGHPEPVLDGNVERVLCRLHGVAEDPRRAPVRRRLRAAAAALLVEGAAGDSNQALMELGALVCTPRQPRCEACPLRGACVARRQGDPEALPVARPKPATRRIALVAAVVERDGRLLLFRRPDDDGLLAGTWELPWAPAAQEGAAAGLAARYGVPFVLGDELGRVRHSITVRRLTVAVRRAEVAGAGAAGLAGPGGSAGRPEARWAAAGELAALPTSSLVRKVLRVAAPSPAG